VAECENIFSAAVVQKDIISSLNSGAGVVSDHHLF